MTENMMVPICCAVLSVLAQLSFAQPPFMIAHSRHGPSSWGVPNEILGSTGGPSVFRPPPGVLISGHGPPVTRPLGPGRHGGRPRLPLMTSTTPIPTASVWPSHGPQIQRAHETSHFEYEVLPHLPKPPTQLRAGPSRFPSRPIPTPPTTRSPPDMLRILAQDALLTSTLRPQSRTDGRPPFIVTSQPAPRPSNFAPTPSDADFQEGFRILNDVFMEDAGADIRSNLVGGSDVSFSGGFFPNLNAPNSRNVSSSVLPQPMQANLPSPLVQITPAKEQSMLVANSPPKNDEPENEASSEEMKASAADDQKQEGTEALYGPPGYQTGPPQSHVSFMFSDPNEQSPGGYNLYDSGYDAGPPPPFHSVGNSILPQPIPRKPQQAPEVRRPAPPTIQFSAPHSSSPPGDGGYDAPPQDNKLRSGPTNVQNSGIPIPMMMLPISAEQIGNDPLPTSDEIQRALNILSRYASKQAQVMGVGPHTLVQQGPTGSIFSSPPQQTNGPSPSTAYSNPPSPSNAYGSPPQEQQQSTPVPSYVPVQVTVQDSSPTTNLESFPTTTEPADAITISATPEESSPFPSFGAPNLLAGGEAGGYGGGSVAGSGGYAGGSGNVGGGGGYSTGAGWSSGGGGAPDLIGAKVNALKSIGNAAIGGIQQVGALKAGILNAGLNVIGGFGNAKSNLANSLKIPIVGKQPVYGAPSPPTSPGDQYGPPQGLGWSNDGGPFSTIINAASAVVGGAARTVAAKGKAAVNIGLSKNQFIKNHFAIKGQAFTESVSKKIANKNEYWQNFFKHVGSIFEAATQKPTGGWAR